jgi:hypothetical protein
VEGLFFKNFKQNGEGANGSWSFFVWCGNYVQKKNQKDKVEFKLSVQLNKPDYFALQWLVHLVFYYNDARSLMKSLNYLILALPNKFCERSGINA